MTKDAVRKSVKKILERADAGVIISKGLESKVGKVEKKARDEQTKYAVEALTKEPFPGTSDTDAPRYSPSAFNALTDDDKRRQIEAGFPGATANYLNRGVESLASNIDDLITVDDGKEVKADRKLLGIANVKDIVESATGKDRNAIEQYLPLISYNTVLKDLKAGKGLSTENEKQVREIYQAAQIRKVVDSMRKAGRTEQLISLAAKVAEITPSEKVEGKALENGVEQAIKTIKNGLEKTIGKDFEDKVASAVGKSLKTLVKSGNPEQEQAAASLWYRAQNGYGIGEREFLNAYK